MLFCIFLKFYFIFSLLLTRTDKTNSVSKENYTMRKVYYNRSESILQQFVFINNATTH
jgi:hypothetical protein